MSRVRLVLSTFLFAAVGLALLPPAGLAAYRAPAAPAVSAASAPLDPIASLRAQTSDRVRIAYHAETGKVRFIGTDNDHPIARPAMLAPNAAPEQAARAFLGAYGSLF